VNGLLAGLGILTMTLFPFALPGLLLALLLVLPLAPLVLAAVALTLLFRFLGRMLRGARALMRSGSDPRRGGRVGGSAELRRNGLPATGDATVMPTHQTTVIQA
jgi:hypothetical protein